MELDGFSLFGQLMAGWLLADFMSGLGHWFEDRMAREHWPFIGPQIVQPNLLHHREPLAMLENGVVDRNLITWVIVAVAGAGLLLVVGPRVWLFAAILGGAMINQSHAWAHDPKLAGRIGRAFQATGLLQSPAVHARHHRVPHDRNYCVLTDFLNPMLDGLRFWRGLEALCAVLGFGPRSD